MPIDDLVTTKVAAEMLGLSQSSVKYAIARGVLKPVTVHNRCNLVHRDEVESYRREHLGQRGKRKKKPATEPAKTE
jgi:hypothetical protein